VGLLDGYNWDTRTYGFVDNFESGRQAESFGFSFGYGPSKEKDIALWCSKRGIVAEKLTGENPYENEIFFGFKVISRSCIKLVLS
jgi:hypothetical protein